MSRWKTAVVRRSCSKLSIWLNKERKERWHVLQRVENTPGDKHRSMLCKRMNTRSHLYILVVQGVRIAAVTAVTAVTAAAAAAAGRQVRKGRKHTWCPSRAFEVLRSSSATGLSSRYSRAEGGVGCAGELPPSSSSPSRRKLSLRARRASRLPSFFPTIRGDDVHLDENDAQDRGGSNTGVAYVPLRDIERYDRECFR